MTTKEILNKTAISNFCEYLKIPSVHPDIDYSQCVTFLEKLAKSLDLPITTHHVVPKKPIVILTWTGTEPKLPSVLFNSHMDVVPVCEDKWTHNPFSGDINGNKIYGRGAQDMKSVGIQYLEAVRRLKQDGVKLKRTIHISFVPDEEIGGEDGMKQFVQTRAFKELNVGVAFDEGVASETDEFVLIYGERCLWQFHVHCVGDSGHGSLLLRNTPGEKVTRILNKFYEFRNQQLQKLKDDPSLITADVTTINLTQIRGGVQVNVVPSEFVVSFDCRIPVDVDFEKWEETINQWCEDAGTDVWIEYSLKQPPMSVTKLDGSNIYWLAFKETVDKLGLKVKPQISTGATDARYVRGVGIPAIGFSPMNNTKVLLHSDDEYLGIDTFLRGIEIYYQVIKSLGNVVEQQ